MSVTALLRGVGLLSLFATCAVLTAQGQAPAPASKKPAVNPEHEASLFTPSGSNRPGKPVTAAADKTGKIQLTVRDAATDKPTFCRVNVVGPDGNFYQPAKNYLSPYAL